MLADYVRTYYIQSFYYDQKAIMSNEEFDNLKEELMWEGSSVVMLSTKIFLCSLFFFGSIIYIIQYRL